MALCSLLTRKGNVMDKDFLVFLLGTVLIILLMWVFIEEQLREYKLRNNK